MIGTCWVIYSKTFNVANHRYNKTTDLGVTFLGCSCNYNAKTFPETIVLNTMRKYEGHSNKIMSATNPKTIVSFNRAKYYNGTI
jgi:hypothetical protein